MGANQYQFPNPSNSSRYFHIHGWQNTLGFKLTDPWVILKLLAITEKFERSTVCH
jgi:hypothetical protein